MIRTTILAIAIAALAAAQTSTTPNATSNPPANAPTVAGAPTASSAPPSIVQISYSPAGLIILEPIVLGTNVAVTRTAGRLTVNSTGSVSNVSFMALTRSTSAPTDGWSAYESWCLALSNASALNNVRVGFEVEQINEAIPAANGNPASNTNFTAMGSVAPVEVNVSPGVTVISSIPPTWLSNRAECGGGPALLMVPANTAFGAGAAGSPTFVRQQVQVVILQ